MYHFALQFHSTMAYTENPTKEEIDALEREIEKSRRRQRVRTAVNPERSYGC